MQGNQYDLAKAAEYWANGQGLDAGRLIYATIRAKDRPRWASRILEFIVDLCGVKSPHFDAVLTAANNPDQWAIGHKLFSALRDLTLTFDAKRQRSGLTEDEKLLSAITVLAECVAKVIYNATNPSDEFDEDCGWWVAAYLRQFVAQQHNEKIAAVAWAKLCSCDN